MSDLEAIERAAAEWGARYGELGQQAASNLKRWMSGQVPLAEKDILKRLLREERQELLFDSFWQVLPFGTGGRRGRVGYGSNRLNPATVAMTVQGHCNYLLRSANFVDKPSVVVACDVRVFQDATGDLAFLGEDHPLLGVSSRSLGRLACEIYAGNGFRVYFPAPAEEMAVLATPELSFLIVCLGALGGINLSASHNPPDDNGTKIYDSFGSQPVSPDDQALIDVMNDVTEIRRIPFDEALGEGLILEVPRSTHEQYLKTYADLFEGIHEPDSDIPIVYTPLCGCGMTTVGELLERFGFPLQVPPQEREPDGSFAVIPFRAPNPEVPQATAPARSFADGVGSGIVLSSDPDADRIGVEVKVGDGSWVHLDGNQIATILAYFLMIDSEGPQRRGLIIETLVTTKALGAIVNRAGSSWIVDDLLVGFKYVAHVLRNLEEKGHYGEIRCRPDDLVLAAEESHGLSMVSGIRDKDAAGGAIFLAALYQKLSSKGQTLLDYYASILEEVGGYDCLNRSIMLRGSQGVMQRDSIMEQLRKDPPTRLAGREVEKIVDYWDEERFGSFTSESDRLPRNVLQVFTAGLVVTIRPSGTEPKLKIYCQLLPEAAPKDLRGMDLLDALRVETVRAASSVYGDLLSRLDTRLSEAALELPDIIDIEQKVSFDQKTVPQLLDRYAAEETPEIDSVLDWLREETAAMTPGADPLPALCGSIRRLCAQWIENGQVNESRVQSLLQWARN
ncbi:MAG: hypothetical protein QF752_05775 [Planctomycetota bacterium]|nr:hypothetical protein [Planctomycetota bacterium]